MTQLTTIHARWRWLALATLTLALSACTEMNAPPPAPTTCASFTETSCQCLDGTTGVLSCEFVGPQDAPQCLCDGPTGGEDVTTPPVEDTTPAQDTTSAQDTEVGPQDSGPPQDTPTTPQDTPPAEDAAPETATDQ